MTKKEVELLQAFNKVSTSLDFLKGCQAGAANYGSIKPNYYANVIESLESDFKDFKSKFFNIFLETEEPE